jgi:Leucine-rich repeat (LRR) protein
MEKHFESANYNPTDFNTVLLFFVTASLDQRYVICAPLHSSLEVVAVCQALSPELLLRHPFLTHSCRTFTINNNLFSDIPPGTFASLGTSFTALSMIKNQLTILGEAYFSTLRNLTRLDLKSNLISAIDPASFSNLVSITTLYVSGMALLWHHHNEQGMRTMPI